MIHQKPIKGNCACTMGGGRVRMGQDMLLQSNIELLFYIKLGFKVLWTFSLCKHYKTKTKIVYRFYKKNVMDFKNLMRIEFCWMQIFKVLIIYKHSLGTCEVRHKNFARSVQPFWRLLDKKEQTDRQAR